MSGKRKLPKRDRCPKGLRYEVYVNRMMGPHLKECLQEVAEIKPEDPIAYMASWLHKAHDSDIYKKNKEQYLKDLYETNMKVQEEKRERENKLKPIHDAICEQEEMYRQALTDEQNALLAYCEMVGDCDEATIRRLAELQKMIYASMRPEDEPTLEEQLLKRFNQKAAALSKRSQRPDSGERAGTVMLPSLPIFGRISTVSPSGRTTFSGYQATSRGSKVFKSMDLGTSPHSLRRGRVEAADIPEEWHKRGFACQSFYDHELYSSCERQSDELDFLPELTPAEIHKQLKSKKDQQKH